MNFRKILDDLSSADASLKPSGDALSAAAAATLQAQQVCSTHFKHSNANVLNGSKLSPSNAITNSSKVASR